MGIKKYLTAIIISAIAIGVLTIMMLAMSGNNVPGFTPLIPIDSLGFQFLYFFTWIWLGAIIGIFFGYILAPLFLFIHKLVIGGKMTYGVHEVRDPTPDKFKGFFKGFFPALMALNFAIIFSSSTVRSIILSTDDVNDPVYVILGVVILLALTSGIAIALFSPVWFLLDSGIVYSNQKKLEKKKIPPEVRSVGGWYIYLLKGYSGISVIFAFYTIVTEYMTVEAGNVGGILLFVALPIIITIFMLPAVILFNMTFEHRKKYMLKFAKKFNNVEVKFELIEK